MRNDKDLESLSGPESFQIAPKLATCSFVLCLFALKFQAFLFVCLFLKLDNIGLYVNVFVKLGCEE